MNYLFIVFLLIAILILLGAHLFVYISLVRFLDIENLRIKQTLLISCFLLSLSFIASSALVHSSGFILVRWFYVAVSVWQGILVYLLLASLLGWVSNIFLKIINRPEVISKFFITLLCAAIIISLYSIVNGQRLTTNEVAVDLPGLPKYWEDKTAVLLSDVHLGAIHNGKFLEKIISQVNEINPDIIFITGDYFDGTYHKHEELIEPLKNLKARDGIYYVRGNHETYIGAKEKIMAIDQYVTVLNNEVKNIKGLDIVGIDYPARAQNFSMEKVLNSLEINSPSILLFHEPRDIEAAKNAGITLQLSGHTHMGQLWPFNYITYLIYGKYHYGLHNEGDYSIYTTNGAGTWGPPMRLFKPSEIVHITFK